jgi:hypothetical protein
MLQNNTSKTLKAIAILLTDICDESTQNKDTNPSTFP